MESNLWMTLSRDLDSDSEEVWEAVEVLDAPYEEHADPSSRCLGQPFCSLRRPYPAAILQKCPHSTVALNFHRTVAIHTWAARQIWTLTYCGRAPQSLVRVELNEWRGRSIRLLQRQLHIQGGFLALFQCIGWLANCFLGGLEHRRQS